MYVGVYDSGPVLEFDGEHDARSTENLKRSEHKLFEHSPSVY